MKQLILGGFNSRSRLSLSLLVSIENLERKQLLSPRMYQTPVKGGHDEDMKKRLSKDLGDDGKLSHDSDMEKKKSTIDNEKIKLPLMEGIDVLVANKESSTINAQPDVFGTGQPRPFPPVASKLVKKLHLSAVTSIIDGLKKLYVEQLKPLEVTYRFNDFVSLPLKSPDLQSQPPVPKKPPDRHVATSIDQPSDYVILQKLSPLMGWSSSTTVNTSFVHLSFNTLLRSLSSCASTYKIFFGTKLITVLWKITNIVAKLTICLFFSFIGWVYLY